MSYELTMTQEDDYLHVEAVGTRTFESVVAITLEIAQVCIRENTTHVLVDVRGLEGRLGTLEAFEIPTDVFAEVKDRSMIYKCAVVDLEEFEESYRFFEDVAVNRAYNLRIFSQTRDAVTWLAE